ncbi:hypothetical protein VTK56DRAFT_2455 [Thermocarpiscus australiensis]
MDPEAPPSSSSLCSSPSSSPTLAPSATTGSDEHPTPPAGSVPLPPASQQSSAPNPDHSAAEGERHPKGKRKRTTAEDKAILEAAYKENPKPDKAARLEIVKRVSLDEKEVQIWFQNRRQNDRRKSRPLSAHEIAALGYGGMQILSSDSVPYNASFSSDNSNAPQVVEYMQPSEQTEGSSVLSDPAAPNCGEGSEKVKEALQEAGQLEERKKVPCTEPAASVSNGRAGGEARQLLTRSFSGSVGYLANRWNAASSSTTAHLGRDESFKHDPPSSSCPPATSVGSTLPLPGSQLSRVRLSMSLDGRAEVVPSVPSPPHPTPAPPNPDALRSLGPIRRPNLQRSHSTSSACPVSMLLNPLSSSSAPLPPRLRRGRSRDVHAWEFCCDSENREDALTEQAKHESSGSAIAAITLLRSTSSTGASPLGQSSSAKRNAAMSRAAPRSGMAKRAKLSRASSSVARVQTIFGPSQKHNIQRSFSARADHDKDKAGTLVSLSGHDSDKENWSPDEEGNQRLSSRRAPRSNGASGRRPLPSSPPRLDRKTPRRIPGQAPSFLSSRANTAPAGGGFQHRRGKRGQSPIEIYEDAEGKSPAADPVLDDEVERFMRGEVSPSKKRDVDAVAGLLSLSKGNWR